MITLPAGARTRKLSVDVPGESLLRSLSHDGELEGTTEPRSRPPNPSVPPGTSVAAEGSSLGERPGEGLGRERLATELGILRAEVGALRAYRGWPWLWRTTAVAMLIGVATGVTGYVFGDSLKARNRAAMRLQIMDRYMSIDNNVPGKRKQMLAFIGNYLVKDDPELRDWVRGEAAMVDEHLERMKREIASLESAVQTLRADLNQANEARDKCSTELEGRTRRLNELETLLRPREPAPRTYDARLQLGQQY